MKSRRRTYGSATAPSSSVSSTCKHKSGSTQLGVPSRGAISQQTSPLLSVTLSLSDTHSRSRCSSETSRRRTYGSVTAPTSSVINTCKHKSGSTQLRVPTGWRFHLKPRHCPLTLSPTRHPRPRCSTETSCRRTYGSATAPSSPVPNTCKQK